MPDLFEEFGALELDKLKEKMASEPENTPKEPETTEQPEKPEDPQRPGLSRRARIAYAAVAAIAVVIAAIFGFSKYQDWKAVDRCRQAIADFQSLDSYYHAQETTVDAYREDISTYWKTADGVLRLYGSTALVELADGQCYRGTFGFTLARVDEDGFHHYERNPVPSQWTPVTAAGSAGPFWLSEYEWQPEDVSLVSREKTDEGQTVVLQFDGAPSTYHSEVTDYTVSFCFDSDGALTSAEIRYDRSETECIHTVELLPTSEEEIEEVFLTQCQYLLLKAETEPAYLSLIQGALEDFRSSGAYRVSEDYNGMDGLYLYDGSRWLYYAHTGYTMLWVDGTLYVHSATLWRQYSSSSNEAAVPWLWDYEWSESDNITLQQAEETADGQIITLLMKNDDYWQSDDSCYTARFTLNSQDELTQISFTYTLLGIEDTRTFTVKEADKEELTAMIDSVFTDAYLKSDPALAPLNMCPRSINALANQESFHVQCEVSPNTLGMSQVKLIGNYYWHGSRGASEWYTVENDEQTLYSLTLYQNGHTQYWQLGSQIVNRGDSSGQSTASDLIADCLPQYDWLSKDLTLLATESTGTGVNILFLIEDQGIQTNVCFTLDNGYNLVSITETNSAQTVTYRVLSTDAGQIDAAIDSIADSIVENITAEYSNDVDQIDRIVEELTGNLPASGDEDILPTP